jgi:hypothetical protein
MADVAAKKEPATTKVVTADDKRVLFEGPDDDARIFVENNFPRPHIQPGVVSEGPAVPDVKLSTGATFDGVEWSDEKGK